MVKILILTGMILRAGFQTRYSSPQVRRKRPHLFIIFSYSPLFSDDFKIEAKNKGSSDEDLPLPPSWVAVPPGQAKALPDFRFVSELKNNSNASYNPHKRLLEALNKQKAESSNPEEYIRSMTSTMAAYNASLLEPKKQATSEALNSFISRYHSGKSYSGKPVTATASTVHSFENYINNNRESFLSFAAIPFPNKNKPKRNQNKNQQLWWRPSGNRSIRRSSM